MSLLSTLFSVGVFGIVMAASMSYFQKYGTAHLGKFGSWLWSKRPKPKTPEEKLESFRKEFDAMCIRSSKLGIKSARNITFTIILILLATPAFATDYYYASASAGGNNGTSCANAYAYNDVSNGWNVAGKQGSDITSHVCGTITFSAGAAAVWAVSTSGTSGHPYTLKFETGAVLQAPYFGNQALQCIGKSYVTIDGGTNGIIKNTDNGTASLGYGNSHSSVLESSDCDHFTLQNLTLGPVYVHAADVNDPNNADAQQTAAIQINGSSTVLITNNHTLDAYEGIAHGNNNLDESTLTFSNNTLENCNRCIVPTVSGCKTITDMTISGNTFPGSYLKWTQPNNDNHHDGIHAFNDFMCPTGRFANLRILNNSFPGAMGDGAQSRGSATGYIYLELIFASSPVTIANNLIYIPCSNLNCFPALITVCDTRDNAGNLGAECDYYNNTILGYNDGSHHGTLIGCGSGVPIVLKNNILGYSTVYQSACNIASTANSDYNSYPDAVDFGAYGSYSAYQTAGYEVHGIGTGDPSLSGSYVPSTGSSVYHTGLDLTSLGIGGLSTSLNSVDRGSGSPWTIGANDVPGGGTPGTVVTIVRLGTLMVLLLIALWLPSLSGKENAISKTTDMVLHR